MSEADSKNRASGFAARAAVRELRNRLAAIGYPSLTVDEAISLGIINDLDWCEELDRQRELRGFTSGKASNDSFAVKVGMGMRR